MVIVLLGIVSAVAIMKSTTPGLVTLPSQAQQMASDIRHAQALAYTSGSRMRVTAVASGNTYSVLTCSNSTTCSTTNFTVTLQKGVTFASGTTATLDFDTLGQPSGNANFTLASGANQIVCVAAVTGAISVIASGQCP